MSRACSRLCFKLRYDGDHMVVMTAGRIVCFGLVSKISLNQNLVAKAAAVLKILRCLRCSLFS